MDSASAANASHRSWIVVVAKAIVVLQSLGIVYMLTSAWVTAVVAVGFIVVFIAVRALSRASRQVDRIFEEELGRQ
ncbi:hypothetical protein SAMN04488564_104264 [Lentzea waywayandensis]|uniref:Uncharacterized protein n=1 Tax=Lentzea waywayandensis TaxID=84724 RepID=A0A1I6EE37_9PSEU|nr:hypothetical protein [Lentzea waywayandensis]SFR15917.1 hypothetical protein SAMN04488564_104264 [Lentzea waywayandensis]